MNNFGKGIIVIFFLLSFIGCSSNIYKNSVNIKDPNKICRVLNTNIADFYEGDCKDSLANGYGEAKGVDSYKGHFKDGLPHGKGEYIKKGEYIYEGMYSEGEFNGKGILKSTDGGIVESHFKDGIFNGNTRIVNPNGICIEGYIKKWDLFSGVEYDGYVTMTLKNGDKRIGHFENETWNGKVTYVYSNGTRETEYWRQGKNVTSYVRKCRKAKTASNAYKGVVTFFNILAGGARDGLKGAAEGGAWGYNRAGKEPIIKAIDCTCGELLRQFDD